ncbi:Phospholipid methyltransferase [Penicillium angulare]|uniref:Phospholipid methyltransferase n=1 Tax=Penicillium angulare TaxID=116970 RepID=UPI002541483F|nr:Phospholipid methyltransferase [Penicillium angulare]KAJ5272641.1 Phospholipid methyltransferase [Penicillium angulare]
MSQASSIVLAITMVASGYLVTICCTAPIKSPKESKRNDTDRLSIMARLVPLFFRQLSILAVAYQALLAITPEYAPSLTTKICPQPENLNPDIFSWSSTSTIALSLIIIGAYARLSGYNGLGRYFTFHLVAPDQLVTGGIYRRMQHPSYTGHLSIVAGCTMLFMRWDGIPACWVQESTLSKLAGWGVPAWVSFMGLSIWLILLRVKDEEDMLEEKFGKQWEEWHRSTKRFIPGLF